MLLFWLSRKKYFSFRSLSDSYFHVKLFIELNKQVKLPYFLTMFIPLSKLCFTNKNYLNFQRKLLRVNVQHSPKLRNVERSPFDYVSLLAGSCRSFELQHDRK